MNITFLLPTERERLNEIFNYTNGQIHSICNEELLAMHYTITTLLGFDLEVSERSIEILNFLAEKGNKLKKLESEKKSNIQSNEFVLCDCGCSVSSILVMSASMGSSCPDCYDDMSD